MLLAFITAPPLAARLLSNRLKHVMLLAAGIGIAASIIGVCLARHLLSVYGMPLSTSGLVVCILLLLFLLAVAWNRIRNRPKLCTILTCGLKPAKTDAG